MSASIQIKGLLGASPTIKSLHDKLSVINFFIAENNIGKEQKTTWYKVIDFVSPDMGQKFLSLRPGQKVTVSGIPGIETWSAKDGSPRAITTIKLKSLVTEKITS